MSNALQEAKNDLVKTMNIKETIEFVKDCIAVGLVPFIRADTGVGKTDIIHQVAAMLNMDLDVLHLAGCSPETFEGLYLIDEDKRTKTCPPAWIPYKQPTAEMLQNGIPKNQGYINPNGTIFFLDEFDRAHEDMRQVSLQLLLSKRIHQTSLPENSAIVLAGNGAGYETYELDPAVKNRVVFVDLKPDPEETIGHLHGKYGTSPIIGWIKGHPDLIEYNGGDHEKLFTPRRFEDAINLYKRVHTKDTKYMRKCFGTCMESEKVGSLMTFLKELSQISFQEVMAGKKKEKVDELVKQQKMDVLSTLAGQIAEYLQDNKSNETEFRAVTDFLLKTPTDLNGWFVNCFSEAYYSNPKGIIYFPYFREKIGKDRVAKSYEKYKAIIESVKKKGAV